LGGKNGECDEPEKRGNELKYATKTSMKGSAMHRIRQPAKNRDGKVREYLTYEPISCKLLGQEKRISRSSETEEVSKIRLAH
jgi:hypothetical protein